MNSTVKKQEAAWKAEKRNRILRAGFQLFAGRGIESVTLPEIATFCGVGKATLYRYYPNKTELVLAIGSMQWREYMEAYKKEKEEELALCQSAAQRLKIFLDAFIDLYKNHPDILRYNYFFNTYVAGEIPTRQQKKSYSEVVQAVKKAFLEVYEEGMEDGSLCSEFTGEAMFSSLFHLMLAAVTRYAVGYLYLPKESVNPEGELLLLERLLLAKFTMTPAL